MAVILPLSPDAGAGALTEAVRVVRRGGVLAIPTESFYALAAPALHAQAVQRVSRMKGRPDGKPILVLVADRTQLRSLVRDIPLAAVVLMDHFWPGPLTLIYPASAGVPEALTAGTGTVGIRQSAYPSLAPVLQRLGPLTGTSANRSGEQPARTAAEVQRAFGAALDLILDGGQTAGGLPSSLVDTAGPVRLLREGPISREQIEAALKQVDLVLES
jgi:L-threonylcarbamoyladenylate synthase